MTEERMLSEFHRMVAKDPDLQSSQVANADGGMHYIATTRLGIKNGAFRRPFTPDERRDLRLLNATELMLRRTEAWREFTRAGRARDSESD